MNFKKDYHIIFGLIIGGVIVYFITFKKILNLITFHQIELLVILKRRNGFLINHSLI